MVPDIEVTASFPESNPFGRTCSMNLNCSKSSDKPADIVNGEKNQIKLLVENKSDLNVTLLRIAGAIQNANTGALIKNV